MKHQYVGDINDYRKYGLLRSLASSEWRVGTCWMVTPDDERADGNKINYLSQPDRWRHHDAELFDALAALVHGSGERHLIHVQTQPLFPCSLFFDEIVPDTLADRRRWFHDALRHLSDASLLFFDPDNGMEVISKPMGTKNSSKYLYFEEVAEAWKTNASMLIYQHFPRERRETFIPRMVAQIKELVPSSVIWPLVTGNVLFLLACQRHHVSAARYGFEKLREMWAGQIKVLDELATISR